MYEEINDIEMYWDIDNLDITHKEGIISDLRTLYEGLEKRLDVDYTKNVVDDNNFCYEEFLLSKYA